MRVAAKHLAVAMACWLLLAVSIGWYYTITYFGRVGWPMPSVETVGALLLYYFSVLNVETEIQAVHWLAVFPLAGGLWAVVLRRTYRGDSARPSLAGLFAALGLASLPLGLPMPYMMYVAGQTGAGWEFQRMIDVALRRGNVSPWWWLSPVYFALGVAAFGLHLWVLHRAFPAPLPAQARHILLASVAYVLAVAVLGSVAAWPLRAWME